MYIPTIQFFNVEVTFLPFHSVLAKMNIISGKYMQITLPIWNIENTNIICFAKILVILVRKNNKFKLNHELTWENI